MKYDNYFYINNQSDNVFSNHNIIEHFDIDSFIGPKGEKGNLGYTGSRGLQGLQGLRGSIGNQGPQGDQGPQGYRGKSGKIGLKGAPGLDGNKGNTGLQGYVGPKGDFGPRGPPGIKGNDGAKGLTGSPGFMGPVGDPGSDGSPGTVKSNYIKDDSVQGLYNIGAQLTMDGFSKVNHNISGLMQNPYHITTIPYSYTINSAKNITCPPNSYIKGFSFLKKGVDRLDDSWGNEDGSEIHTGWKKTKAKGKDGKGKKVGNDWNNTRHGMPHSYKVNCHKLNSSNTIISGIYKL